MKRRILWWTAAVFAVVFLWALYRAFASPPFGAMGEVIEPEEQVLTSQIISNGVSIVNAYQTNGVYHRDGHPKNQGCAAATFTARPLAWPFNQGVFATTNPHKAWIRFSSGNPEIQGDWKPDARGMAVKVLGVDGPKLLEGEQNLRTQDFLMINNPAFFIASVQEYAELTRLQAIGAATNSQATQFSYFFPGGPFSWRLRELRLALQLLKWPPYNLLAERYYTISAYALGVQNYVKYSAVPVACSATEQVPGSMIWSLSSDALSHELADNLKSRRYCFDLTVQTQVPQKNMPVEDTTVEWKPSESPFFPVARIEIAKQDIQPYFASGFCENLSYSPWHALTVHRPVGGLNRIRKAVYQSISSYRHCENGAPTGEPKEDGTPVLDGGTCAATAPFPGTAKQ